MILSLIMTSGVVFWPRSLISINTHAYVTTASRPEVWLSQASFVAAACCVTVITAIQVVQLLAFKPLMDMHQNTVSSRGLA